MKRTKRRMAVRRRMMRVTTNKAIKSLLRRANNRPSAGSEHMGRSQVVLLDWVSLRVPLPSFRSLCVFLRPPRSVVRRIRVSCDDVILKVYLIEYYDL